MNAVAIVTAASKGMGAAVARELHDRGYRLALMARSQDVETLADELGGLAVRGSVTETADLERIVRAALDRFGRIDAVVNHTGHPPKGDLLAIPDGDWHLGLGMVLMNVVRMARLVTRISRRDAGRSSTCRASPLSNRMRTFRSRPRFERRSQPS